MRGVERLWALWRALRPADAAPWRTLLVVLGLAAGVALQVAVTLVNTASLETVRRGFDALAGPVALSVVGPEGGFDEALLARVRAVPGVAAAAPVVEAHGYVAGRDGRPRGLVVLGVDPLAEHALGRLPWLVGATRPPAALGTAALVSERFARAEGLDAGASLELGTTTGSAHLVVAGTLPTDGLGTAFGGQVALVELEAAQAAFGRRGRVDRVDLALAAGTSADALVPRLAQHLGPGLRVERPAARGEILARMLDAFQALLAAVGLTAVLVSALLVSNLLGSVVAGRREAVALARLLGAHRRSVFALVLAEAAALAAVASTLGVGLGRALAARLVEAVGATISGLIIQPLAVREVCLEPGAAAAGVALGVVAAVAGAVPPAWAALRVQPAEALRALELPGATPPGARHGVRSAALGAALLVALAVTSRLGVDRIFGGAAIVEVALALAAVLLLASPSVALVVELARRWLARGGGEWRFALRLGAEALARHPHRTAAGVRSLVLGVWLVVLVATLAASFKHTVTSWFSATLRHELLVTGRGSIVSGQLQPLHEDVGVELLEVPGVARPPSGRPQGLRFTQVSVGSSRLALKAFDRPESEAGWAAFELRGAPQRAAAEALFAGSEGEPSGRRERPAALVSEALAAREGLGPGSELVLETPSGPSRFAVAGVVTDYASAEGVVYLDRRVYRRLWGDPLVSGFGLELVPGAEARVVQRALEARFGPSRGFVVSTVGDVRRETVAVLDDAFAFTRALVAAALVVGLFGLFNALAVSVLARTRELCLVLVVGQSRAQLLAQLLGEAALQGLAGGVVAAALGLVVARAWLVGAVGRVLGWRLDFVLPWDVVLVALVAGLGVGLAAGLWPALRAGVGGGVAYPGRR